LLIGLSCPLIGEGHEIQGWIHVLRGWSQIQGSWQKGMAGEAVGEKDARGWQKNKAAIARM